MDPIVLTGGLVVSGELAEVGRIRGRRGGFRRGWRGGGGWWGWTPYPVVIPTRKRQRVLRIDARDLDRLEELVDRLERTLR